MSTHRRSSADDPKAVRRKTLSYEPEKETAKESRSHKQTLIQQSPVRGAEPTIRQFARNRDMTSAFSLRTHFKTFTEIATVRVGPSETPFLIHLSLLAHCSPFFTAALCPPQLSSSGTCKTSSRPRFTESLTQTLKLPEETVEHFEMFIQWLYTQRLDPVSYFKDGKPAYYTLLQLYALADRLCVEQLRNEVIDTIAEVADKTNSVLTPSDTWILYDCLRESAPVRRLVLDLFAFKKTDRLLAEHPDEWHPSFLKDLVVKLKKPDESAVARHEVVRGTALGSGRACGVCARVMVGTSGGGDVREFKECRDCRKAFCMKCAGIGKGICGFEEGLAVCKPWKGSRQRCQAYHEHRETRKEVS